MYRKASGIPAQVGGAQVHFPFRLRGIWESDGKEARFGMKAHDMSGVRLMIYQSSMPHVKNLKMRKTNNSLRLGRQGCPSVQAPAYKRQHHEIPCIHLMACRMRTNLEGANTAYLIVKRAASAKNFVIIKRKLGRPAGNFWSLKVSQLPRVTVMAVLLR